MDINNKSNEYKIGIFGGGQLAKFMAESAINLGYKVYVLDPSDKCPASFSGAQQIKGSFLLAIDILNFIQKVNPNILTYDIESINIEAIKQFIKSSNNDVEIHPHLDFLKIIQNKWTQKQFYLENNLPTTNIFTVEQIKNNDKFNSFNFVLKTKRGGYDGKGVWNINSIEDIDNIINKTGFLEEAFYLEEKIKIKDELAFIICSGLRDNKQEYKFYPITKLYQEDGICIKTETPYEVEDIIKYKIQYLGVQILKYLQQKTKKKYCGILAIEFFLTKDNQLLINEISPRVHNSGHYTMEGCYTSQFENHIRAITGMNVSNTDLKNKSEKIIMKNILSTGKMLTDNPFYYNNLLKEKLDINIHIHWYHKNLK